ncbi:MULTISPECIES: Ig domain-containing protein [unclassified Fusibacter]|uniref:Ig-like domain-containing protein n=1 Tax=unclassified Fusibacter TaxID=2624464 RepID=UPI0010139960|nr:MULTISPECIES: Ig-like domain-containing protein [unclassified Fusibacter]MCK8060335.1 Ig-like domain-containing protein [Fusibacter sp. A2]NPE20376.1 hypothetical protein [Fusibacter sp. A1]RXV63582.1 hypothetical protein DWB64_00990 [Fusibacter sp. A1]
MNKAVLRKSLAYLLVAILCFSSNSYFAATVADYTWNNEIPIKYPSAETNNGKLVLFDNSHAETAGQADWVLDGAFSDFADDLVAHGYTVREYRGIDKNSDGVIRFYDDRQPENVSINEAVITYDAIKDADVFIMAEANRPFTISEYAALKQFVDAGKGIYFISDHYNADRNLNTWDSTETYNGYNRSTDAAYNMGGEYGDLRNPQDATKGWLAENFGVRFRFNAMNLIAGFSGIASPSDSEGITQDVQPILMAAGSTLAIVDGNKAKGIVYLSDTDLPTKWNNAADEGIYYGGTAEGPYVVISKPSAGKAAFIGDSSPIEDDTPKYKNQGSGSAKSTHPGYKSAGTANILSVNIVDWLSTPESYIGFDGVNHSKGINTPNPLAPSEMNQTQAEPWATPTYDPWNTDTYAFDSYGAPQGTIPVAVTGVTLNTSALTLDQGQKSILVASMLPAEATNTNVTWTSSDSNIATVVNGVVKGVSEGSAVVTATTEDGNKTATCAVTVTANVVAVVVNEGFDSVIGSSSSISSGIPAGWTVSSGVGVYTSTGNFGASSPSLKFGSTGQQIETETFTINNNATLSFWLKGNATDNLSSLLIEKYEGTTWSTVSLVSNLPAVETTLNFNVSSDTNKLRFTYTKSTGNLAIDDIKLEAASSSIAVQGVTLDVTSASLDVGQQLSLAASVLPTDASDKSVTWSSSNESVATVSSGTVTAVAEGTAVITVTTVDGGKKAACSVIVAPSAPVTLIDEGFDGVVGSSSSISSGLPTGWTTSSGMGVYTSSGNYGNSSPSIKFSSTGHSLVTPTFNLTAQGTLSLWAKGNGTDASSMLLIEKYTNNSWSTLTSLTNLPVNGTVINASVPQGVSQLRFTYTKSTGNLAIDDIKLEGTSSVIAVTGITLDKSTQSMDTGSSFTLNASLAPIEATDQSVTWSSSNSAVATVNNGLVTGISQGTAVITVTSTDGNYTATCTVTVTDPVIHVASVGLDKTNVDMIIGTTNVLVATVLPTNATDQTVIWTSSNSSVITVANGNITAVSPGTAVVTATSVDGNIASSCTINVTLPPAPTSISEGFDSVIGTKSTITSGIPADWTFSDGLGVYTSNGNYGQSAPSIKMSSAGNQITSPEFYLMGNGSVSFWIKGNGVNSASYLLVEKFDGTSWSQLDSLSSLPTTGTTVSIALDKSTSQLRFTYFKSSGNLAIDDISIQ